MEKLFFLQIAHPSGEISLAVKTDDEIIEAFGFRDCTDCDYRVFRAKEFGVVEPLRHIPADHALFNYHKFVDSHGVVVFAGFSAAH